MSVTQKIEIVPLPASKRPTPDSGNARLMKATNLADLAELFMPHVDEVIRPRAKTGIASLMRLILDDAPAIKPLIASIKDGTAPKSRVKAFRACGIGIVPVTLDVLTKSAENETKEVIENSAMALVVAWLETFRPAGFDPVVIDTDLLDAAMLPALDYPASQRFSKACRIACLELEEAMSVLCNVRASLPKESPFPDAAAAFLDVDVITCRQ